MKREKMSIEQIEFAPYNPRKIKSEELKKLKNSIKTYECYEPIIVNSRTSHVVGGNQRLRALIELGYKEVDVVIVDLSLDQEKVFNIGLNKISGEWDEDKLAVLLEELQKMPDLDVDLTGFDSSEISQLLDSYHEAKEDDNFDFEAAVDSIKESTVQTGDLIELGPHRILCGDSSNPEHIKLLLGDEKVNLLNCDPPYNVSYYGGNRPHAHARPKKHKLWNRIYADNFSQEDYEKWLKNIFSNINPYFAKGAPIYVWNGHRQFGPMYLMLTELGFHVSCVLTWKKERFSIGFGDYNQASEFCLYGWKKDNGGHAWYGPTNESTIWEVHRDPTKTYLHPTQKPIALAQRAIQNSSKRGDLVLDTFLGSGSTLIAADSLGRRCFGIEIDPRYCQAIIKRYVAFVGRDKVSQELVQKYMREDSDDKK
jgi:DNA modification methylase